MASLPESDHLIVEQTKVAGYLLALDHPEGGAKAKYFLKRGFTHESWEAMAEALKQHGRTQSITETSETRFGRKFTVECQIETPDGRDPCILTAWIQEGARPPRLVTAHPNH